MKLSGFFLRLFLSFAVLLFALIAVVERPAPSLAQTEKPELILQNGHSLRSDSLAFSPDGRYLASASSDATIRIWDAVTGNELRTLTGHIGGVRAVAFSFDGKMLASGGMDGKVKLWEAASGREVTNFDGHKGRVNAVAFSRDGRLLASGGIDNSVKLWDIATKREARTLNGHAGWVNAVVFSPDSQTIVSASADRSIKSWDAATGQLRQTASGHRDAVISLAVSPVGGLLASGGADSSVRFWRLPQLNPENSLNFNFDAGRINALSFSADGNQLFAASTERTIKQLELPARSNRIFFSEPDRLEKYEAVAFSPQSQLMALCDGTRDLEVRSFVTINQPTKLTSKANPVRALAFSADGRWFATGNQDTSTTLWDVYAGRVVANFAGNAGSISAVAFSPDSLTLATGSRGGMIRLTEAVGAREIKSWQAHDDGINAALFTVDGKQLITCSSDQSIKVWDTTNYNLITKLTAHTTEVNSLAISPDGKLLASGDSGGVIKIWDSSNWREVKTLAAHIGPVFTMAFSNDGKSLASGSADKSVKLWQSSDWQPSKTITESNAAIYSLTFASDDRKLAFGNADAAIKLIETSSGKVLRTLSGASGNVNSLSFSDDGLWLCSGHEDGSLRVWNGESGELTATALSLRETNDWLVVTPDGLFDGSPDAWPQILWRFERSTFNVAPVEIFFNEFFYPDLLADILASKKPKAKDNITQLDRRQPQVRMLLGSETAAVGLKPFASDQRTINVKLEVRESKTGQPQGSGAQDVRLFRNGALYKVWRGDVLKGRESAIIETQVPIVAGENRLTAYAFNRDNIKSPDESRIVIGADSLRKLGTAYILAIGVNRYANQGYNLKFAVDDAKDFSEELRQKQGALNRFANIEVVTLFDAQATKANIVAALQRFKGQPLPATAPPELGKLKLTQPEDAVFIYFAGHGVAVDSRFYLIPHDLGYAGKRDAITETGLRRVLNNSISDEELVKLFEGVDARQLLLVIDACNSGQALESEEKRRGPMNSKGLAQLAYEKGISILTAAQGYQAALENAELGHGYLTYALIEDGLKKMEADRRPRDGRVLLREWLDHATDKVPRMQEKNYQAEVQRLLKTKNLKQLKGKNKLKPEAQRPRVFYRREPDLQPMVIAAQR